jgi:hypothetical protein
MLGASFNLCFAVVLMESSASFKESGELIGWYSSGQRLNCLNVSLMYFSVSINTLFACWEFLKDLFCKER